MADNEQLLITLGVQDKGASQQINALNKEIKALDKEFKSASAVSKEFEKSSEGLKTKLSYLEKSYTANNTKLEAYKKRMQETNEAIAKKQAELEKLNSAEEVNQKAINKANEQLEKMKNTLRTTAQNITLTENEMKRLTNEINNTNSALKNEALDAYKKKMQDFGESIQGTGGKIKNVGEHISGAGDKILALSAPLVGVAVASGKMATDFATDFAKISTVLDDSNTDFTKYKSDVLQASTDTGIAVGEFSDAVYESISASVEQNKAIGFTSNAMKLAKGGFTQGAKAVDILTTAINGYKLSSDDATNISDKLIVTQNLGKTTVDQLASSMGAVIPIANNANFSLDELCASYALMTKNGIATAESGTYIKSMLSELTKNGTLTDKALKELTGKGFADLKKEGKSTADILNMLSDYAQKDGKTLKDMFGSVEAGTGALSLASANGKDYNEMLSAMADSAGATQKAFDKMNSTPAEKMARAINKTKNEMIKLGENATPIIENISDIIGTLADKFGKLTTEEQQNILKMTGFAVAGGTILKVGGGIVSSIGSMVTGFGKLTAFLGGTATEAGVLTSGLSGISAVALPLTGVIAGVVGAVALYNEEQDAFSAKVTTSKEDLGVLKTTLLELNGVHVKSRSELEKSGLAYKELGKDLGEDFKNKVNESTKAISDFNYYLGTINMDGVLTSEETTGFTSRVDTMFNTAIESIKSKQATTQTEMSKMFTLSDGTLDQSEQQVLDYLNKNYKTNIEEVTKLKNDVNAIYKQAVDEKRPLNEQEIKDVQDKIAKIKQIEIEALANNEQEQLFAKNEFINRVKQVDAKGAEELLLAQKQTLDKQNAQTLASYDTQIETMKLAREKAEGADRENLDKQIQLKTEERDKIIEKQRETWTGCIGVVEEMNPQLNGKINEYTGELLTNADLNAQKGIASLNKYYDGMNEATTTGWYRMKNTTTGSMDDIYVSVDANTGKINGAWNSTTGVVGGYTDEIKTKVKELGQAHESEKLTISNALGAIAGASVNTKDQMVNAMGEVVGQLENVTTASDGTRTGFINLNGTPIEIKTNADGTITSMHEVKSSVEEIPKEKTVTISFWQRGLDAIKSAWNSITNKNVSVDENETGTYNYSGGLSTVDESNFELASNNNVSLLGTYYENSLAYIPSGTSIRTHMQSVSDMKNEVSKQINSLLANKNLSNNTNAEIDYNKLAEANAEALLKILGNIIPNVYVEVDANGMVNKAVNKTMDTLKRQTRNNTVSKGSV